MAEAKSINQSYKEIVDPKFYNVADIDAVCRVKSEVLETLLNMSKSFDSRWNMLSASYDMLANCVDKVRDETRDVVFPNMPRGGDIAQSMRNQIMSAVDRVSQTQKQVSELSVEIDQSRKALNTFKQIRQGGMCPRSAMQ